MKEEVYSKVGDICRSGRRTEVKKTTVKGRMGKKGEGERVVGRKQMVETLKDSDGVDRAGSNVKGIKRW